MNFYRTRRILCSAVDAKTGTEIPHVVVEMRVHRKVRGKDRTNSQVIKANASGQFVIPGDFYFSLFGFGPLFDSGPSMRLFLSHPDYVPNETLVFYWQWKSVRMFVYELKPNETTGFAVVRMQKYPTAGAR